MEVPGHTNSLCLDLIHSLRAAPEGGREAWLVPLLQTVERATGATLAYLGETCSRGWVRTAAIGGALASREQRHLRGLSRRLLHAWDSLLLPLIAPGSAFHTRCDGWDGMRVTSYGAVKVPLDGPEQRWLICLRSGGEPFGTETLGWLRLAAEAFAAAAEHEERTRGLRQMAMTDGLTHIPNYRALRSAVEQEIARAARCDEWFTVVMVDVDNLKKYNLQHGHLAGSDVLRHLARILSESVRRTDLAAKYGGDEFLLVLPHTRPEGGVVLSERIRQTIHENLRGCAGEVLSCSFGVAGFPEDGTDFEGLVRAADSALYRAKKEGRNAVVCVARDELPALREEAA